MNYKVQAFKQARAQSNLLVKNAFALDKDASKAAFAGLFNKAYSGDAYEQLIMAVLAPFNKLVPVSMRTTGMSQEDRRNVNTLKKMVATVKEQQHSKYGISKMVRLKKFSTSFQVDVPILTGVSAVQTLISTMFGGEDNAAEALKHIPEGEKLDFKLADIFQTKITAGLKAVLKDCCTGGYFEKQKEGAVTAFLSFLIDRPEAEAMVNQEFVTIRPTDIYPMLSLWREADFEKKGYGRTSMPVSRIASTLPKFTDADTRIDSYGISVGPNGRPLFILRNCDNTERYEDLFFEAGQKNGTFTLKADASDHPKLPINIPVLVDWVNQKFSYTNTGGEITVVDLSHNRKCTAAGAINMLRRIHVDKKQTTITENFARLTNTPVDIASYLPKEVASDEKFARYVRGGLTELFSVFDTKSWFEVCSTAPTSADYGNMDLGDGTTLVMYLAGAFVEFFRKLAKNSADNLEAIYQSYGVHTVTQTLGLYTLIGTYGADLETTEKSKAKEVQAAAEQGVDPNWTPPPCPLITSKFNDGTGGMLPHQVKVRNMLKGMAPNAVLPVAAGGGKSMLSITDVLYFIEQGFQGPFMLMCPSHLISNYVAEVVDFTDGRMNVIPFTSYNIRTSGFARYEKLLENAPRNTVLVVDYDVLKYRGKSTVYGTTSVPVFPVVDCIRRFAPQYVMMDESHFLKNAKSARARSVMALVADIPYKRIASGTLNPDSPSDLPGQLALLDPTVLGTRDEFNMRYGDKVSGDRVQVWRTSGEDSIYTILPRVMEDMVWAPAKRKEWACALPERQDRFIKVELTEGQRKVYDALFNDMIKTIRQNALHDKGAAAVLQSLLGKGDEGENEDDPVDDSLDLGPALQPFLADLERFVTDPASHPYSKDGFVDADEKQVPPLTGNDLLSPKANAIRQILTDHLKVNNGKVLIFVNYHASAEAIFNSMPDSLKQQGILYSASSKVEDIARFKTDESKTWLIGIRKSIEVGLNLQVASRLIRVEGVWNPGEQEQGDSRIERPNFKEGGEKRTKLYFDTLVADKTIDITKAARLRAKLVAVAKFENATDERYQAIEDIPILPMKLDIIQTMNSFDESLAPYQRSMAALNSVIKADNDEWRAKIMAQGGFKMTEVQEAEVPDDAALMSRVPYAPGTELYAADQLGLVRVDTFLGLDLQDAEDDEGEDAVDATEVDDAEDSLVTTQRNLLLGLRAHCEYGDGIIVGAAARGKTSGITRVAVRLDDGTTAKGLRATNVFVQTRTETNGKDMRKMLAKAAGLKVTDTIDVPGTNVTLTKVTKKALKEALKKAAAEEKALQEQARSSTNLKVDLSLSIVNGFMRLSYEGEDKTTYKALQAHGFRPDRPYIYTRIKNARQLRNQMQIWADAGFIADDKVVNDAFISLHEELKTNGLKTSKHYTKLVNKAAFDNYLRKEMKPTSNPKELRFFAMVNDALTGKAATRAKNAGLSPKFGAAYLCLPVGGGFPATKRAVQTRYKDKDTTWRQSTGSLSIFVQNVAAIKKVFAQLVNSGIRIENLKQLSAIAKQVKRMPTKTEGIDVFSNDEE